MNTEEFFQQQTYDFWRQKALDDVHQENWKRQSAYGHKPPPTASSQSRPNPSGLGVKAAVRRSLAMPPATNQSAAIQRIKQKAAVGAGDASLWLAIQELKSVVANLPRAMAQAEAQQVRKSEARPTQAGPRPKLVNPHVPTPASGYSEPQTVYSIRDIVRASVGIND